MTDNTKTYGSMGDDKNHNPQDQSGQPTSGNQDFDKRGQKGGEAQHQSGQTNPLNEEEESKDDQPGGNL